MFGCMKNAAGCLSKIVTCKGELCVQGGSLASGLLLSSCSGLAVVQMIILHAPPTAASIILFVVALIDFNVIASEA